MKDYLIKGNDQDYKFSLPQSWSECSLELFERIYNLVKITEPGPMQVLRAITDLPLEVCYKIPASHVGEIITDFAQLKFEELKTLSHIESFEFKGKTYYFTTDLGMECIGAFEDWKQYLHQVTPETHVRYTVAFYARREGERYDPYSLKERAEAFKQLPVTSAYGTATFFLHKHKILQAVLKDCLYLTEELMNNYSTTSTSKTEAAKLTHGGTWQRFMKWRRGIF